MSPEASAAYTLELVTGGLARKWSKTLQYKDDDAAIAEARALLVAWSQERGFSGTASLLVAHVRGDADIRWLGAWHWDDGPMWMTA